ncbi:nucleoporin Nup35 isoform X2 [Lucilia sericata]|uniref:nucleoporin Nup35 isoform X2 n=1 Tax=Lucilia sericata TaxID=13632 RepID=UPI0018A8043E|nr:nucleoporin Nup35 isoform X2 [Lucilia sericata]
MEPMALGSPSGSPATNQYLPSFLLGEQQTPTTPRNNTLSPNKAGARNVSFGFATSPSGMGANSPQDYNRSVLGQKTLFGGYQQTPPTIQNINNYPGTPIQSHNASMSGPPTQGLFDSLRNDRNQVQTPTRSLQPQNQFGTPIMGQQNASISSAYNMNQSTHQNTPAGQFNESYMGNNSSFNISRMGVMSPLVPGTGNVNNTGGINNASLMMQCPPQPRYTEFWVTVFGFPSTATSTVMQHFAQCGTIVDKVFPSQNGNWVHIKYSSRLECDKALNYNEKILSNNIMIGVTQCKDKNIIDKENLCENNTNSLTPKVRPLAQTAYKSAQNDTSVVAGVNAPQKSSGIMNKAMDLFFGW